MGSSDGRSLGRHAQLGLPTGTACTLSAVGPRRVLVSHYCWRSCVRSIMGK